VQKTRSPKSREGARSPASAAWLLPLALLLPACEEYDGVPYGHIAGLDNGSLTDRTAPLVVAFDKPVLTASAKVEVVRLVLDQEGNLGDEDSDPNTSLDTLFAYDGSSTDDPTGGTASWSQDRTQLTITPAVGFPVAEKLAVLLEPGLSDDRGHAYIARERLPFSYEVKLSCAPSADFTSGAYFFLADVKKPIAVQVQLLAIIDVDPATGKFVGEFVNADRNKDPSRCAPAGLSCNDTEACRTLPMPACVAPSEKAASPDEYPDFLPNYDPPTGFSFTVHGCVDGKSSDKTLFVNIPVDVHVQSPNVSLTSTILTASFAKDDKGVLRGDGAIAADHVLLGTADSGKAEGVVSARSIPMGEEPKGLKGPDQSP
jgi:hypothetical protein